LLTLHRLTVDPLIAFLSRQATRVRTWPAFAASNRVME
jgi:hypothetical protein